MIPHLRALQNIAALIGGTPLLAIDFTFQGRRRTVYTKVEYLSMTGSIKDRMAFTIMEQAYRRGELCPGDPIIEVSSGNTGISFAAIGCALGHPVTIFIPDWVSRERSTLLSELGAKVISFTKEEGGFTDSITRAEQMAHDLGAAFLPSQFSNPDNIRAHYETTAPEIYHQLRALSLEVDAFVAGVGTGGSVMGVGRFLKEHNSEIRVHPLEPASAPLRQGRDDGGSHRIEGLSDGLVPSILDMSCLDEMVSVDDGDAILMARKLASQLGLGVGISSGANFLGALKVLEERGNDAVVVTLFADDNKKYLSTDLFREERGKDEYLTPDIELLHFKAFTSQKQKLELPSS